MSESMPEALGAAAAPAASRPRLHVVYFMLAAFDLLTALVSLTLIDQITGIYRQSVGKSQWWSDRLSDLADLSLSAHRANAPGNDAFQSDVPGNDAAEKRALMLAQAEQFHQQLDTLRARLAARGNVVVEPALLQECDAAAMQMLQMEAEAETTFDFLEKGELERAGQSMARMDQAYGLVSSTLDDLGRRAVHAQQQHLESQARNATRFRNSELVIAALIILMVAGVTVYGHKLAQQMKSTARQMEQSVAALKDSEARIRAVVDSALDGIITVSDSGRCESLNPAAARLFGYERHEIAGQRVDLLLPGVGAGDPMHPRPVLHDFGASPVATQARRKNGERFPAELVVSRGQLSGRPFFTCVVRDITERKRSEAELERHREHLASLVDERTAQLEASHQQLRLTERLAAIGTLAAGLGHDMNNVLFPVRCRLDALGSTGIDPTALPGELAAVRQAIDYLQQLCDGLRLLALDADDASACDAATQLGAWWREVKPLLLSALPRGVTLETRWPDDLPAIAVPAHRLTQAVFNLVVNAGEAIAREGVVTIGAALLEDHRFVRITVTDTGRGMSSEELRRALDPFFTTKKRGLATGLGLSLVHGVAHVAGGGVEIESAPGRGTSVQMTLPVAAAAAPTPAPAPSRTASVTLRDRRLATFVGALLRAQGIDVQFTDGAPQARSSLWITEPTEDHLEPARQFTHAGRSHRLILFGKIPNEWRALSAACVDESHGLDAIRGAIQLAVASPAGPSA